MDDANEVAENGSLDIRDHHKIGKKSIREYLKLTKY